MGGRIRSGIGGRLGPNTQDEDAGDPGWTADAATESNGDPLVGDGLFGIGDSYVRLRPIDVLANCR